MHLYKSWDDSFYLTDKYDGEVGHKLELLGNTTVSEINAVTGYKECVQVYRALHGMKSNIEIINL